MLIVNAVNQYLEQTILKDTTWIAKALIVIVFLAICINFGFDLKRWAYIKNFVTIVSGGSANPQLCCYYWSDIAYQTTDLLMQRLRVWDVVHQANMRFRPVLPVLWMLFHSALAIYCLQLLLGIAQLYMTIRLIYTLTQDRLQAFYFTIGFAGLFSGAAFYLDLYGFGDAFAYAFMTAALFFRRPSLIFLSVFLAALVDERALLNTSYIVLFHWIIANLHNKKPLNGRALYLSPQVWAVLAGGFVYLAIRFYLTIHFQLRTPYGGPSPFFYVREASKFFGIRLWTGFESFWILIILMLFSLYHQRYSSQKAYRLLVIISFLLGVTILTFLLQGDHTRTAAYAFPVLFISITILQQELNHQEIRSTLFIVSTLSLIFFPIYY